MTDPPVYAFDSSEALIESMLGRQLIPGVEGALTTPTRQWLTKNGCERQAHARGRGRYLVTEELARRWREECWPQIKAGARG